MKLIELLNSKKLTVYKLSKQSKIALTTINDIVSGKANLFECRARIIYQLAKSLNIKMEELLELEQETFNKLFETDTPYFLQDCLNKVKRYKKSNPLYDCYLDELNSSINVAEIEMLISKEQANYLRNKYLR